MIIVKKLKSLEQVLSERKFRRDRDGDLWCDGDCIVSGMLKHFGKECECECEERYGPGYKIDGYYFSDELFESDDFIKEDEFKL